VPVPRGVPKSGKVDPDLRLQYLIVLSGTEPLVWRRIRIPASYSFWDFHVAIQDAMGWLDSHLHEFRVLDPPSGVSVIVGSPDPDLSMDRSVTPEYTQFPIDYAESPQPIQYTYDFGDDWSHAVIFEGFEQSDSEVVAPELIAGAGACPLEDSGGAHHYAHIIRVLNDPSHPEYADFVEWAGGPIDPSAFSMSEVRFDDPDERWDRAHGPGAF